ncbi:unnamed protein product [Diatraea saccharalis]|uniref:Uncharacterized protein n=1 Tax=Diatraea saccharalis TaxID=40085 RepID=A0A9N9WDA8_9NEOP|nr:unnamed protein product [Diatraea saccharalis]
MSSKAPSEAASHCSAFINYENANLKYLCSSVIQNMESIKQDVLQIERNLKNIVQKAGPLENQLSAVLHTLPKLNVTLPMDTE